MGKGQERQKDLTPANQTQRNHKKLQTGGYGYRNPKDSPQITKNRNGRV